MIYASRYVDDRTAPLPQKLDTRKLGAPNVKQRGDNTRMGSWPLKWVSFSASMRYRREKDNRSRNVYSMIEGSERCVRPAATSPRLPSKSQIVKYSKECRAPSLLAVACRLAKLYTTGMTPHSAFRAKCERPQRTLLQLRREYIVRW